MPDQLLFTLGFIAVAFVWALPSAIGSWVMDTHRAKVRREKLAAQLAAAKVPAADPGVVLRW